MYIEETQRYYRQGDDCIRKARFLILVQPKLDTSIGWEEYKKRYPIRALVRKVALHQFGHFMMGSARAFGHRIPISGSYGSDGLPREVPMEVYERAVEVPTWLIAEWNNGGGWNEAGSEALSMCEWAIKNLKELEPKK